MFKHLFLHILLYSITFSSFAQNLSTTPEYVEGQIFVKIKNEANVTLPTFQADNIPVKYPALRDVVNTYKIQTLSKPFEKLNSETLQNTYLLTFNKQDNVEQLIKEIENISYIEYAEKVPRYRLMGDANDPRMTDQWYLDQIQARQAWDIGTGNKSVVVAVVDDAVDINHPDLKANLWVNPGEIPNNGIDDDQNGFVDDIHGYDVADKDNNPAPPSKAFYDLFSHGTHVAGIIGASTNNGKGVASISYGVSIMSVKCNFDATNDKEVIDVGWTGLQYAIQAGADIINISWGGTGQSVSYENLINFAEEQGTLIVAAAGNLNSEIPFYPAAYDNVLCVAASTSKDTKASFSNYGDWINITAPGTNIISTIADPNNDYGVKGGTSMASPVTASLAALLLSNNSSLSPADIIQAIHSTADNINDENPNYIGKLGSGRINAYKALQSVKTNGCLIPNDLTYTILTDGTVNLNWDISTSSDGYIVEVRKSGGTWSTFNTTNNSYNYTNINACDSYDYRVRSTCGSNKSAYSEIATFSIPQTDPSYCDAFSSDAFNTEWIESITVGSNTFTSGANDGYGYYACDVIQLDKSKSNQIALTPGFGPVGASTEYWRVWIDYNQDGDFNDADELAFDSGQTSTTTVNGTIDIPTTAKQGRTRLRIIMKWIGQNNADKPEPCDQFNYGEVEDYSAYISGTTPDAPDPCDTPTSLSVSNVTETGAQLQWQSISGAVNYDIQYKVKSSSNWNTAQKSSSNSKTITNLQDGTTYEWKVKTLCAENQSTYSSTYTFTTEETVECPTPPSISVQSVATNEVTLAWKNDALADLYYIEYRPKNTSSWKIKMDNDGIITINNLDSETTYETRIKAECDAMSSNYSSITTFTTEAAACNPPLGFGASEVTDNSAEISWTSVTGAKNYTVRYRKSGTSSWSTQTSSNTYLTLTQLSDATNYEFQIRTNCNSNNSIYTNSSVFVTLSAQNICAKPSQISVTNVETNGVTVNWSQAANTAKTTIFCRELNAGWQQFNTGNNYYQLTNLKAGTTYEYKLKSTCQDGISSEESSTKTFATEAIATCNPPSQITASNQTKTAAALSWNAVEGATQYTLQHRKSGSFSWSYTKANTNSFTFNNLSACSDYEVQIYTQCGDLGSSNPSYVYTFKTICDPDNPNPTNYCLAQGLNANYEWISGVKINDLNYSSGSDNGYGDHTDQTVTLEAGQTYTIELSAAYAAQPFEEHWKVWIDYNQDGDFKEAGETVITSEGTKETLTASFTLPQEIPAGNTRMRIAMSFEESPAEPCENFKYGEIEDYTVNIQSDFAVDEPSDEVPNLTYCNIKSIDARYEWIEKVQLGSINNLSGNNNGYYFFSNLSTQLDKGQSYDLTLEPGYDGQAYAEYWQVWIDYNQNGEFDNNEIAYDVGTARKGSVYGKIVVPNIAKPGKTRMRVVMHYKEAAAVCGEFKYGEAEDYIVEIVGEDTGGGILSYCDGRGEKATHEWIAKVEFGLINNPSGSNNGYGDFRSLSTPVEQGKNYPITLTPGYRSSAYAEYFMVWIDYNQDGEFSDEEVAFDPGSAQKSAVNGIINIPPNAVLGSTTMRIAMKYKDPALACEKYPYGETEEYTVEIIEAAQVQSVAIEEDPAIPQAPVRCSESNINLAFEYEADGLQVDYITTATGDIDEYFWSFGDGNFSYEASPSHKYAEGGSYYFSLEISNNETGCSESFDGYIHVFDPAQKQRGYQGPLNK